MTQLSAYSPIRSAEPAFRATGGWLSALPTQDRQDVSATERESSAAWRLPPTMRALRTTTTAEEKPDRGRPLIEGDRHGRSREAEANLLHDQLIVTARR